MTNNFYNDNATSFFNDTVDADLSAIYQKFLPLLASGAHILDAGCGSGRDTHYFISQGFRVTAFDASEVLVLKAQEFTGIDVTVNTFENFRDKSSAKNADDLFDAIWACASLLHVPSKHLPASFSNLSAQLKQGGVFYCSFKYGTNDTAKNGRDFTNANEERLLSFIQNSNLKMVNTWITEDVRPNRQDEKWLNAILIKN